MNTEIDELTTDDEALRESGMVDGKKMVSNLKLRPITAESWSWMQTVQIFSDDIGTNHQGAAFAFLHSEPEDFVRGLVFKRSEFWPEVSKWIGKNHQHHKEMDVYWSEFNDSIDRYKAALTTAANPSQPGIQGPKN